MSPKIRNWVEDLLPLDIPEYAKQPEALLTDLLWRSKGSSISVQIKIKRGGKLSKLVLRRNNGKLKKVIETTPFAEKSDISGLIIVPEGISSPVKALLVSLQAPKARGDKSLACVPIHPDAIMLQTLHGLVNKDSPQNLAHTIEMVGWLGGSAGEGHVAVLFIDVTGRQSDVGKGFTGLADNMIPEVIKQAWIALEGSPWPRVMPGEIDQTRRSLIAQCYQITPFQWFWDKWQTLCTSANNWYGVLPSRRFVDWATCLLRTGLSFAYIWEANFYFLLQECVIDELENRKNKTNNSNALVALKAMLENGATLASIESPRIPASQKHAWNSLSNLLARGHEIRRRFDDRIGPALLPDVGKDVSSLVSGWLKTLDLEDLKYLAIRPSVSTSTAPNVREFVRYLLKPRSSDDDTRDQADFYYLAKTNSKSFWFQPGPEWFVVVTSLLGRHPGGNCTLGNLLEDLRKLGVRIERSNLVELLEEAGLSTDSPDADNAIVIKAGF